MTGRLGRQTIWFTCRWSGKRSWETKAAAKQAARRTGPGLSTYQCRKCGYYHVGHSSAEWRARQREAMVS